MSKYVLITDKSVIKGVIDNSMVDAVVMDTETNSYVASTIQNGEYIADFIVSGSIVKKFYWEFGVLYRMLGRAIDLELTIVVMSQPLDNNDQIYKKNLNLRSDGRYFYDIRKRFSEINEVGLENNILPLGNFETIEVTHKYGHNPKKYGCVVELDLPEVDTEKLRAELNSFVGDGSTGYVSDRFDQILVPAPELINYLKFVGFSTDKYVVYPLNKKGSPYLSSDIPKYVNDVFEKLGVSTFRQNYVISKSGWSTIWHRDHSTPVLHGFRLMIPIDPVYMCFECGEIILKPGKYYFVNNSLLHKGKTLEGLSHRANLLAQMCSDIEILKGKVLL